MRKASLLLALLAAALPLPGYAGAPPAPSDVSPYLPAAVCGRCHQETYASWSRTIHALAAIDPVFVEALARLDKAGAREAGRSCLSCHSPTTVASGDYDLKLPVSREGVTCSFCHSVTAVNLSAGEGRFVNAPEKLATAIEGKDIREHHFEQHELTMSSEFCAGCHQYTNGNGLAVLSTYSEWKESFYAAEKITCQQCHMPISLGAEEVPEGAKSLQPTNLHFQMGGHSQDQLVAAARLEVEPVLEAAAIHLDTSLTNLKAGHKLPTGLPNRKMHLHIDLFDRKGLLVDSEEMVFGRVIVDGDGTVLEDVTDQFLRGARELSDNRILPREARRNRFTFARPPEEDFILAEVSVVYEIQTPYLVPPVMRFDVAKKRIPISEDLLEEDRDPPVLPSLAIIVAVFIIVSVIMVVLLRRRSGGGAVN